MLNAQLSPSSSITSNSLLLKHDMSDHMAFNTALEHFYANALAAFDHRTSVLAALTRPACPSSATNMSWLWRRKLAASRRKSRSRWCPGTGTPRKEASTPSSRPPSARCHVHASHGSLLSPPVLTFCCHMGLTWWRADADRLASRCVTPADLHLRR